LFKYFQKYKNFPNKNDHGLEEIIQNISKKLTLTGVINWESSSMEKNKKEIRSLFGYAIITSR
jgi:hypothetical protein